MTRHFLAIIFTFITLTATPQNKLREVDELINKTDRGWTLLEEWIKSAKNKVDILAVDTTKAKDALYKAQVTTYSPAPDLYTPLYLSAK